MKRIFVTLLVFLFSAAAVAEAVTPQQLNRIDQLKQEVAELFKEGKFKQTVPLLKKILLLDPMDRTASRYLMLAERQSVEDFCKEAHDSFVEGNYQEAINSWEKLLAISTEDTRAEALIEMTRNLIRDDTLDALYALADTFMKEGDYQNAVNELEKILAVKPDDKRARQMMVTARQAIVNARIQAHYEQAEAYMNAEEYERAIEEWQSILQIDEKQKEASRLIAAARRRELDTMYDKARELHEQGDYLASRDRYYKVMAANPTDEDVKGIVERLNGTIKVVQKIEGEGRVYDMLRKALSNHISPEGNAKAAIAAAWYAEQLDPSNELAFAIRSYLEREHLLVFRSMEAPIRDMDIIDQYLFAALNHIYEGRYDRAVEESSIVIELEPNNTLAWKRLGSAYFALGKKDKAKEAWEKALKFSPDDKELKQFIKRLKK